MRMDLDYRSGITQLAANHQCSKYHRSQGRPGPSTSIACSLLLSENMGLYTCKYVYGTPTFFFVIQPLPIRLIAFNSSSILLLGLSPILSQVLSYHSHSQISSFVGKKLKNPIQSFFSNKALQTEHLSALSSLSHPFVLHPILLFTPCKYCLKISNTWYWNSLPPDLRQFCIISYPTRKTEIFMHVLLVVQNW